MATSAASARPTRTLAALPSRLSDRFPGALAGKRAYLSRYTHRVAISNRRLISADETGITFRWKDCRIEGPGRYQTMTLSTNEFPSR